ncbi:MAG: peptide deformylase [Gemmatimonadales bacterium]|nr:MAG: peptide deformylase [Gemmatimonadales bacterium]
MAIRELRYLGDPVLRESAAPVDTFDDELRRLVDDMFQTMVYEEGAGLAAPQIGISRQVLVVDVSAGGEEGRVALINPRIVESSDETEKEPEGCLSIPGVTEVVRRPARVRLEGFDPEGEPIEVEAEGLFARALQHEVDHLEGVLFIDHLSALKRRMLLKKYRKLQAEEAPG